MSGAFAELNTEVLDGRAVGSRSRLRIRMVVEGQEPIRDCLADVLADRLSTLNRSAHHVEVQNLDIVDGLLSVIRDRLTVDKVATFHVTTPHATTHRATVLPISI